MQTPDYSLTTLANGLPLIRIPMKSVGSVTALVLTNTGSRYETPEQAGIAHFFEHIVFKGTARFPTALDLSSAVDAIGAEFNAFTSKEYTGYYVKSASKHLTTSLDVLSDMLLEPAIRQEDIDREKGVIIEEINMYKDNPMAQVGMLFDQLFFADYGLKHDIVGTRETVSSIDSAAFEHFLGKWYSRQNMVLVLAGDADVLQAQETVDLAEKMFSKVPKITRAEEKVAVEKSFGTTPISNDYLWVEEKKTEQAHLVMGWPGIKRASDDRSALSLLAVALGGNMSSRLFTEVREKRGLCYYVRSEADYYHDTGVVGASAGVDPKRVVEAVKVIKEECMAIATGARPITADELSRAKEYVSGMTVLSLEDSESVAQYFGSKQLLMGVIETPAEALAKIQATTLEQVNMLAKRIFSQKMKLAVIGPFGDKKIFEEFVQ
ncbi:insulinase family protein [Candidatus Woesebacteria bacterium]|nr:insulinase family protein [Candidatus Woesebacteria bacterium]